MTRQALRVFMQGWFCGCGAPQVAASRLRDLLACHPLYDHHSAFEALLPDPGLQYLLSYTLDHFELTEHGGNVLGAWLTPLGKDVLAALDREKVDDFEALMAQCCFHGYAIDTELQDCAECAALNSKREKPGERSTQEYYDATGRKGGK